MIAVEKSEERRLGSGGSLDAPETYVVAGTSDIAEVPEQFLQVVCVSVRRSRFRNAMEGSLTYLDPKSASLAHGGKLGGLIVGESEGRECAVLFSEVRQPVDHDDKFVYQDIATLPEKYEVCVAVFTRSMSAQRGTENGEGRRTL